MLYSRVTRYIPKFKLEWNPEVNKLRCRKGEVQSTLAALQIWIAIILYGDDDLSHFRSMLKGLHRLLRLVPRERFRDHWMEIVLLEDLDNFVVHLRVHTEYASDYVRPS